MFKETMKKLLSFALVLLMVGASIVAIVPTVEAEAANKLMTASEFITILKKIATEYKTLYVMGGQGASLNDYAKNRFINNYPYNQRDDRKPKINAATVDTFAFDCVGLVKSVLWGWNGTLNHFHGGASYGSNGIGDMSINNMLSLCSDVSTDFSNIKPGEFLVCALSNGTWGHCGIYIGDGLVIEATPSWKDCVQITALQNVGSVSGYPSRTWSKHGQLPWITYCPCDDYTDDGICKDCNTAFKWENTFNPADAGTYKITADFTPRTNAPYEVASKADKQLKKDATVTVLGSYTNAHGSKWYKFTYDSGKVGYVYESYLKLTARNKLSVVCTGFKPENNASLPYGQGYPMYGTITSSNPLKTVEAYLDGSKYATWTASNQSTTKFDINPTDINQKLEFGKLSAGKHTISLKATDIFGQTNTFYTSSFTIASNFNQQNILQMEASSSSNYISGTWCEYYYGALCTCQSTSSSKGCADRAADSIWNHRTIHRSGCGIVALVSAIYNTGNGSITKDRIAEAVKEFMNWGGDKGYWLRGMKSNDFFTQSDDKFGSKYGYKISGGQGQSLTNLINHLKNDQGTAVVHVYGHYMVAVDYKYENGVEYLLIFDPFPGAGAGVATGNYSTNRRNVTNASGDWFSVADLTDDGGSKGSFGSKENIEIKNYWLVTPASGSSSGGSSQSTITPATITEGTYHFVNDEYIMYMISDTSGTNNIGASNGTVNSKYQFKIVKDGSYYKIVPADGKNGYVLNSFWASGSTTKNGDEVTLYKNTTDPSQRWVFEKCGDGYLIHPADATHLSITREGSKLYVKTTTKAANQIWKLESPECSHTYDNTCDATCNKCGEVREITHDWEYIFDDDTGHIAKCKVCGKEEDDMHAPDGKFYYNDTHDFLYCTECKTYFEYSRHSYDNSCDTSCRICGYVRTVTHTYDGNCDAECNVCGETRTAGTHEYDNKCDATCNVCGATRTVGSHMYDNICDTTCNNCGYVREAAHSYEWVRNNETHCQECSICGKQTEPVEHEYRMVGMMTDPALKDYHYYGCDICKWAVKELHVYDNDCDKDCNVCAYSGREVEHAASNEYGYDSEIHAKKCPTCGGYYAEEEHKYTNDCDTTCNVCSYERSITHSYGDLLLSDADGHWNACSVCGEKGNFEEHNPGPEATEDSAQVCLDCGYVLEGKKNHEHVYGDYVHNEYQHWRECEADDCDARSDSAGHDFGNDCDVDCSVCGYVRSVQHEFTNDCDESCNVCGETRETEHVYSDESDADCNVCGDVRDIDNGGNNGGNNGDNNGGENNPGGETGEKPGNEPDGEDDPIDEPPVDDPKDNTTTVIIIAAAAVVTIFGLALIFRKRS